MAIKLIIEDLENSSLKNHELDQSLITFGRSKSCHIELDHIGVSRRHCFIKFIDGSYYLVDEGSRHGTLIDGQRLDPHSPFLLSSEHQVELPGFGIHLVSDEQQPRLERTTTYAQKLLDELLQGTTLERECPILKAENGKYHFVFIEEKTSFVLGSCLTVDFVVHDQSIQKKHVSFTRDINGIRIIPLPNHPVFINDEEVLEPYLLGESAHIRIGDLLFFYQEQEEKKADKVLEQSAFHDDKTAIPSNTFHESLPSKKRVSFLALDRVFFFALAFLLAGVSVVLFQMI